MYTFWNKFQTTWSNTNLYSISCDQLIKQFNLERTCLFFINKIIFYSLEAGNCVSNSSFKWMKNTHKQFSSAPKVNRLSAQSYSSHTVGFQSWTNVSVVVPASYRRCADTPLSLTSDPFRVSSQSFLQTGSWISHVGRTEAGRQDAG